MKSIEGAVKEQTALDSLSSLRRLTLDDLDNKIENKLEPLGAGLDPTDSESDMVFTDMLKEIVEEDKMPEHRYLMRSMTGDKINIYSVEGIINYAIHSKDNLMKSSGILTDEILADFPINENSETAIKERKLKRTSRFGGSK